MARRFTPRLDEARKEMETAEWRDEKPQLERHFTDARTYLLMRHHFFGRLAMKLKYVFTERVPTMAVTADMYCYANPKFIMKLNVAELAFVIAHEISHVGFLHFDRVGNRHRDLWNEATDYMINSMLLEAGLVPPVLDERWKDHPEYERLLEKKKENGHDFVMLYNKKFKDMTDVQIYDVLWEGWKERMMQGLSTPQCPTCGQDGPGQTRSSGQQKAASQHQPQASSDSQRSGAQGSSSQSQGHSHQNQAQNQGANGQAQQQGHGGGQAQSQDAVQGQDQGRGSGSGQDQDQNQDQGQDQNQGRGQGQGQRKGNNAQHGDTCPDCGRPIQKQVQGGWGTSRGDMDIDATRELQQNQDPEKGGLVPSPSQVRGMLIAAAAAAQSQDRGSVPAGFQRWIDELRDPKLPWNRLLERWLSAVLVSGRSYRRPSRSSGSLVKAARMQGLARGVRPMLPGPKPDLRPVIIGVDTSGSRLEEDLREDLSEVFGVLERYSNPIRVIVWDAQVHFDDYVRSVDEIELKGGGGTATEPMFEAIERDPGHYGPPAALVCFTDGMASYPTEEPPYPVLWVWTGSGEIPETPPFGEVITIERHGYLGFASPAKSHETIIPPVPAASPKRSRSR